MVCLWLVGATGCGPVLYVTQVTSKASASVAAAKAAEADVYAPYHYTLAVHYLHKAREEAAAADFQAANRFGRLSHKAGEQARELAVQRAAEPGDTSWKPPRGAPGYDGPAPAGEPKGDDAGEPKGDDAGDGGGAQSGGAAESADDAEKARPEADEEARPEGTKPEATPKPETKPKPEATPKARAAKARPEAARPTEDGQ
jgi:hypothetical protein